MHFGSTFLLWLRMMLVGVWLGLYWVLFSFFDHFYILSSVQYIQSSFSSASSASNIGGLEVLPCVCFLCSGFEVGLLFSFNAFPFLNSVRSMMNDKSPSKENAQDDKRRYSATPIPTISFDVAARSLS